MDLHNASPLISPLKQPITPQTHGLAEAAMAVTSKAAGRKMASTGPAGHFFTCPMLQVQQDGSVKDHKSVTDLLYLRL